LGYYTDTSARTGGERAQTVTGGSRFCCFEEKTPPLLFTETKKSQAVKHPSQSKKQTTTQETTGLSPKMELE